MYVDQEFLYYVSAKHMQKLENSLILQNRSKTPLRSKNYVKSKTKFFEDLDLVSYQYCSSLYNRINYNNVINILLSQNEIHTFPVRPFFKRGLKKYYNQKNSHSIESIQKMYKMQNKNILKILTSKSEFELAQITAYTLNFFSPVVDSTVF